MNRKLLWIALAALLLPVALRLIWYYPGFGQRPKAATPDYQSLTIPLPPLETPLAGGEVARPGGTVVFDANHANAFQPSELEVLTGALSQRGARIEYDDASGNLATRLKYASAYVVVSPNTGFSADEIRAVQAFVGRGGRLVVLTDATRGQLSFDFFTGATSNFPDVNAANPLLAAFDITINNDYLYNLAENEGNFRNVYFDDFGKDELTFGLNRVAFYGTHSIESATGRVLLFGSDQTLSSLTDAHSSSVGAAALSANGSVLALGDFTFLTIPYDGVADNRTFVANLADFMLGGERKTALSDFPYVFSSNELNVLPTSDVQMTAELVGALSRLQLALQPVDVRVSVTQEAPSSGDLLVLGTFAPTDDLSAYVDPFDVVLDDFAEFVEVPGFGKVGRFGNGVLLFQSGPRGNTLTLLADTTLDLASLLDAISGGNMFGCLLQDEVGVCSIGFGGTFSEEPTPEFVPFETPLEPFEATPTPFG